jgi:poly(3-hydroxybutyrate) depolymerase
MLNGGPLSSSGQPSEKARSGQVMNNAQPTTKLYDLESTTMGMSEQISVVLPPGYDSSESLPLLIRLHGGGEDRAELQRTRQID